MDFTQQSFVIVRGFIDAKDDKSAALYGSLVALVSKKDVPYVSVGFSRSAVSKETSWTNLLSIHADKQITAGRDTTDIRSEEMLYDFLYKTDILNGIVKNHSAKSAEQAVSRFCMDQLALKAVTFLDFVDATQSDIEYFNTLRSDGPDGEGTTKKITAEETGIGTPGGPEGKKANDVFVRCEPVLDPIAGVAMNEIAVGDYVYAKLTPDSVFYKLMAKTNRGFDGLITAEVTGMLVNDLGTSTISLRLSDDVSGVMKMSGKVRIRTAGRAAGAESSAAPSRSSGLSPEVVIGFVIFAGLIAAALLIYYVFFGN